MRKAHRNIVLVAVSQTISGCYLGFCCWVGLDQVLVLGEGHMQLWKQKKKEKDVKHQVHFDAWFNYFNYVSECVLVLTQHLLNFVWNSPSVHTVGWFIDVLLEVMMILTLSHFENQLHPSCHADASSHAVDSFFCTIRGSYGRRLKKKQQQNNINVKDFSFSISDGVQWQLTGTLWLSNKTLVYDSIHSNVQPLNHVKD